MARQSDRDASSAELLTLIDLFIVSKQIEGRSSKTLDWYRANLERFEAYLNRGEPARLHDLNLERARSFVGHLQGKRTRYGGEGFRPMEQGGLSSHTIHGYVRTLKAFGSWLHQEGYLDIHPFGRLKLPKLAQTMVEILTDVEIARIMSTMNVDTYLGARLQAIFLLLLDTGIRASELCNLTLSNTYLQQGYIKVRGKGDKERIVPFGATTRKSLMRYIHLFRPEPAREDIDPLILSVNGTALTYEGLRQIVRRLSKAAEVPRLHVHLLRHTFAVRYLMNGGDLMSLKLMLGHTSLGVTQMYLHLAESHVQVQHNKFSPVDRLDLPKVPRKRR